LAAPCIYLAHRRADLWAEPERFDPDRFFGARVNPSAFFPFGGGVRRCIGAAFATFETKVVLTRILSRVKLSLASGYAPKAIRSSIALAPSGGMPVTVTKTLH
jgi:cytochrome P450 family 110